MPMHHGRSLTVDNAFYVDATLGNDSNSGRSPAQAWRTLSRTSLYVFNPGDRILLKRGELWRDTLIILQSGTASKPIEVCAYGTGTAPTICGADISALSWALFSGNTWRATLAYDPGALRVNGTFGTKKASEGALAAQYDWFWDGATTLSLFSTTDPTGKTVEIPVRALAVACTKNFNIYTGLIFELATPTFGNFLLSGGAANNTIRQCESRYTGGSGIIVYTDAGASNVIDANQLHDCEWGCHGFIHTASGSGTETIVRANECYNNNTSGVLVRANFWIVEKNQIYSNGNNSNPTIGLHIYGGTSVGEGTGDNNVIRYNRCHHNTGSDFDGGGIALDQFCDTNDIYGNVCYANRSYGISIFDSTGCNFYSNTCYGNVTDGTLVVGEITAVSSVADRTANWNCKDNIGYATGAGPSVAIYIDANTADNTGISIDSNLWFRASGNWYTNGASSGSVLATWNAFAFVGTDFNADPLFTNTGSDIYTLQSGSPARNAGVNLGTTYQLALDPAASWPSSVITANQNSFGAAWEIGGYVFKE